MYVEQPCAANIIGPMSRRRIDMEGLLHEKTGLELGNGDGDLRFRGVQPGLRMSQCDIQEAVSAIVNEFKKSG